MKKQKHPIVIYQLLFLLMIKPKKTIVGACVDNLTGCVCPSLFYLKQANSSSLKANLPESCNSQSALLQRPKAFIMRTLWKSSEKTRDFKGAVWNFTCVNTTHSH